MLSDHPERFRFYEPPAKRKRKLIITDEDGKVTIKSL